MVIKATYKSGITEEIECFESVINGPFYERTDLISVVIPEGVKKICGNAFYNCINLESVAFPTTLKTIDCGAFMGCISLKECHIPSDLRGIRDNAFKYSGIEILYIKSIEVIEDSAFYHCTNLKSVIIDEYPHIMFIARSAFEACYNMVSFDHKGIGVIMDYAFRYCLRLKKIDMTGVYNLGHGAFQSCISLTEITNLWGCAIEEDCPFIGCDNIKYITLNPSNMEISVEELVDIQFSKNKADISINLITTE